MTVELREFIARWGRERVGFLTLTFADDVQDMKEAGRRFHSLATGYLGGVFESWITVKERQKSGRVHYHLLVACPESIAGAGWHKRGGSWEMRYVPANLSRLWASLREHLPRYGFGRHELYPIREGEGQVTSYIAGYLQKSKRCERDKGVRQIEFRRTGRVTSSRFSWNSARSYRYRCLMKRIGQSMFGVSEPSFLAWLGDRAVGLYVNHVAHRAIPRGLESMVSPGRDTARANDHEGLFSEWVKGAGKGFYWKYRKVLGDGLPDDLMTREEQYQAVHMLSPARVGECKTDVYCGDDGRWRAVLVKCREVSPDGLRSSWDVVAERVCGSECPQVVDRFKPSEFCASDGARVA